MSTEEYLRNKDDKKELEKMLHANLETIAGSHAMVNLIHEYLEEKDEEKKKKIFCKILSPGESTGPRHID